MKQLINKCKSWWDSKEVKTPQKDDTECVIGWGAGFYDVKENKPVTHNVVSIFIDNHNSMVTVSIQKGTRVNTINLSMQHAQEIGFINVKALKKYCNF